MFVTAVALVAVPLEASREFRAIQQALEATSQTSANFTQKFTPKGFRNERVEKGTVVFGELPRMRWTYTRPEAKVFVFDGSTSWFYSPEEKQVMIHRLSEEERAELPFLLLGDQQAVGRDFAVSLRESGTRALIELTPTTGQVSIQHLTVTKNARTHRIERLEYVDRQGNRTVFEFSGFRKSQAGPQTFRFDPPAGVDVVRN